MSFLTFGGVGGGFVAGMTGNGLSLRAGPPRTALGGPPMLSCRLFLCGKGGAEGWG